MTQWVVCEGRGTSQAEVQGIGDELWAQVHCGRSRENILEGWRGKYRLSQNEPRSEAFILKIIKST